MKLEFNKAYKNRIGEKVTVVCVSNYDPAIVILSTGTPVWLSNGCVYRDSDNYHHNNDIVAEWVEECPIREVTRREIVPGDYGIARIHDDYSMTINPSSNPEDWEELAHLCNQLAEFYKDA